MPHTPVFRVSAWFSVAKARRVAGGLTYRSAQAYLLHPGVTRKCGPAFIFYGCILLCMNNTVIFAGGCFWCVDHDMREAPGVVSVTSGYTGGKTENPTYEEVCREDTGHREAVLVEFDTTKTSFKKLTQYFLDHIDPTDTGGQFGDRGESYKTAIYYANDEEKTIAENLLQELNESGVYRAPAVVEVLPRQTFYNAEEYHQNYAEKNAFHYSVYRKGSGREGFVNRTCQIREEKHINWKE